MERVSPATTLLSATCWRSIDAARRRMGWAVQWSGQDLAKALREDSSGILGRPYAMYIVALATEVDLDALNWLREYGRAIDSLTGADVAFLTFCNSTVNHAVQVRRRLGSKEYIDYVDAESTNIIFHSGRTTPPVITLDADDGTLMMKLRGKAGHRMAFVRSMANSTMP
jgi:hypothetical protein